MRATKAFVWPEVQQLFVPTVTLALLGAVESLLCARVADGLSTLRRHDPNQELVVMMYNVSKWSTANFKGIAMLAEEAFSNGWYVLGVTASPFADAEEIRHEHQLPFDYVQCDEKTIKTAIRANPGLILLKEGVVMAKWHGNDTPTFAQAQQRLQ